MSEPAVVIAMEWVLPLVAAASVLTTAVVIVLWQADRYDRRYWRERALTLEAEHGEPIPGRKFDIVIADDRAESQVVTLLDDNTYRVVFEGTKGTCESYIRDARRYAKDGHRLATRMLDRRHDIVIVD